MSAVPQSKQFTDYRCADLALADWGRKEIAIAETEMPGLMSIRDEFAAKQPLKGARITGSLHMTIQTAVLIETLASRSRCVRCAGPRAISSQRRITLLPRSPATGVPVFAWKGETLEEYWDCTLDAITSQRPDQRPLEHRWSTTAAT